MLGIMAGMDQKDSYAVGWFSQMLGIMAGMDQKDSLQ